MSVFEGILLGLLQGVAEFLPISSSGHLAVAQRLLGLDDVPLLFDVFLHLATLCAVLLFFRRKIGELFGVFGRLLLRRPVRTEREAQGRRYILAVILTTLVTGIIGIIVEKKLGGLSIKYVCAGFVCTGVLLLGSALWDSRRKGRSVPEPDGERAPSWRQALAIGLAQGVGTLPGISRSGATITGARLCGVTRSVAGEFSFIASIPAILGAFLLELKDLGEMGASLGIAPVAAGGLVAFVSGYAALTWLMGLIRRGRLAWFACYLIPAGILGILFL